MSSMTPKLRRSIHVLVEICYDMAEDSFADEPNSDHFFMDVLRVAEWLEGCGMRTPLRPISTPPPHRESPPKSDAQKATLLDRVKALRAEAEAIKDDATTDDSLHMSMMEVADICTSEIEGLHSPEANEPADVTAAGQGGETGRYHCQRSKDGVDETFDLYEPGKERPFASIAFWEAEEWAENLARRTVAALNVCEGVPTEVLEQGVTVGKK